MRPTHLLLAATALVAACSGRSAPEAHLPTTAAAQSTSSTPTPALQVAAQRMPNSYVHFPVSSADLRHVINVHGRFLAAIADEGAFFGSVYPALSTNDGASWMIAGPRMSRAAADGAHVTDRVDATSNNTVVLWGRGGNFVETLPPGSAHWYQSDVGGTVHRLSVTHRMIAVYLDGSPSPEVSTDDGLHWSP